jgi:phosphoribosyl-ATP pyrophosphohydrolase
LRLYQKLKGLIMQADLYENIALQFFTPGHRHHEDLVTGLREEAAEVNSATHLGTRKQVLDELGDVLWYVTVMAKQQNSSLSEIMKINCEKLEDRALNGKKGNQHA